MALTDRLIRNTNKGLAVLTTFIVATVFILPKLVFAYGECSQYGLMVTYNSYSNTCTCMSGYVMGKGPLGSPYCVSGSSYCYNLYGLGSEYNYLTKGCGCSSGYVLNSDLFGNPQCTLGSTYCHNKYGIFSSYQSYSSSCVCDSGYTFDSSNQCVKKQNNVYFTLKQLDTDGQEAVIRSSYDLRYYHIKYGIGCLAGSFRRYINRNIVVNLGTDFSLDTWDTIVLQDDDETCNITYRESVYSDFVLQQDEFFNYIPSSTTNCPLFSYPSGSSCTCINGYTPNTEKTLCVPAVTVTPTPTQTIDIRCRLSFGDNSIPAPNDLTKCTCRSGYQWSSDGKLCVTTPPTPLATQQIVKTLAPKPTGIKTPTLSQKITTPEASTLILNNTVVTSSDSLENPKQTPGPQRTNWLKKLWHFLFG